MVIDDFFLSGMNHKYFRNYANQQTGAYFSYALAEL